MTKRQSDTDIFMTREHVESFLDNMEKQGRSKGSLSSYRRVLERLWDFLPEDKILTAETGNLWRARMQEEENLSMRTVNMRVSVYNSFMRWLGKRHWQVETFFQTMDQVQPELSRAEYLRLLSAARHSDREKSYLIIKTLGGAGVRMQELSQLTAEAVEKGSAVLSSHNGMRQRVLHLPRTLREELAGYLERENIKSGPVFVNEEGKALDRSVVYYCVSSVSRDARVEPEKANPRCLWKMYCSTRDDIEASVRMLTEERYERMMEDEQLAIGWGGVT